jgi:hypothetical protein
MDKRIANYGGLMDIVCIIIEAVARIVVPIVVAVIGGLSVKGINDTRYENNEKDIEKRLREHIRGYSDEEAAFMEKTLNEVFSKPRMRWYR